MCPDNKLGEHLVIRRRYKSISSRDDLCSRSRQDRIDDLSLLRLRRAVKKNVFWRKVCRQTTSRVFSSVPQGCSSQSPRVQSIIYCLPVPFTISCQVFLSCLSIFTTVRAALSAHLVDIFREIVHREGTSRSECIVTQDGHENSENQT